MMKLAIIPFLMLLAITSFPQGKQRPRPGDKPQNQPKIAEESDEVIKIETDLVSIDLKLTDSKGQIKPIAGLKANDFIVFEDGVRQKIANLSSTETPFNVVLLIDTSGSTGEQLLLIRTAAMQFIEKLRPTDRIAIVQFNREPYLITDFTSDRGVINSAMTQFQRGHATAFYDALQFSYEELLGKVDGRKAVIALTDAVDSFGYNTYQETLQLIEKSGAGFYFLELDTEADYESGIMRDCVDNKHLEFSIKQIRKYYEDYLKKPYDQTANGDHCSLGKMERREINKKLFKLARREIREMADKSGGRVYAVKELAKLQSVFSQIANELRTQYSLSYYPTNEKRDGSYRNIKIEIKRPKIMISAKPGYRL